MRLYFTLLLITTFAAPVFSGSNNCAGSSRKGATQKITVASPEEDNYDIKGLKFDINLSNKSTDVNGSVTTYARTNTAGFALYAFEMNAVITVDSVKIDNQLYLNTVTAGSVRKVTLTNALPANTDFTAQVFYHGQSPSGTGQFFTGGLNHVTLPSGTELMYSLSDDLYTDDWWPCKQSLGDKIDSVSMWITVDDTLKAASNGLLQKTTVMPGNKLRYEWKTSYPIEYYLICVAVGPYDEYNYYMHYTDGSNDSMLIQNFIYDAATFLTPAHKLMLDSTGLIVDYFSQLYGRYPFTHEKYGHCMTILSGGMEHQTMTFMTGPNLQMTTIAHELGHQWWGNNVTYGKWDDIWLSEGLATYGEQLFLENYWGAAAAKGTRTAIFNQVLSQAGGSVWVDDTTNVNRIFDTRLTYYKGASVAHMLRYLAPADSLFFKGLKAYQQQYKYGNAVTADFQAVMEQAYNMPLDSFFRQWIYGEGYPVYTVKWEQSGALVHVKIDQATSHNSVKLFNIPLEIKLTSDAGDTIIKINIEEISKHHLFVWDKTAKSLFIDPNDQIVNKSTLVQRDPALLSVGADIFSNIKIYPNPATDSWNVVNILPGTMLQLYDMEGRLIWQGKASEQATIPAAHLAPGIYLLQSGADGVPAEYFRLIK